MVELAAIAAGEALCRDLPDVDDYDDNPAGALREAYGARPDEEFIREGVAHALEMALSGW